MSGARDSLSSRRPSIDVATTRSSSIPPRSCASCWWSKYASWSKPTRKLPLEHAELQHPEWLLLAALILDSVGDDASPVELARRVSHRLDLGATAEQQIALLVADADLFRGRSPQG